MSFEQQEQEEEAAIDPIEERKETTTTCLRKEQHKTRWRCRGNGTEAKDSCGGGESSLEAEDGSAAKGGGGHRWLQSLSLVSIWNGRRWQWLMRKREIQIKKEGEMQFDFFLIYQKMEAIKCFFF